MIFYRLNSETPAVPPLHSMRHHGSYALMPMYQCFYFTFKGKVFVFFLPFQGLASLEKVKHICYLFHQSIKILKNSQTSKGNRLKRRC